MKCNKILDIIESIAPTSLAYENDNVGLLVGDRNSTITGVLCALEFDENTLNEAIEKNANLLITHHPIMYKPIQNVTADTYEGRLIIKAIQNGINFYAAHTNLDIAKNGLNDYLSEILGFPNVLPLEMVSPNESIGRFAIIDKEITLKDLAMKMKSKLNMPHIKYAGNHDAIIRTAAINTGGGTGCIDAALEKKADVFITGDYKYQQAKECVEAGMNIIDVGHYESEICAATWFYNLLNGKIEVPLFISERQEPTFKNIF